MPATEKTFQQKRYRIVHCFGRSKTNTVYEAYDNILKSNVVIEEFVNSERFVSPIRQQARKAAFVEKAGVLTTISNEFLPRVYDYFSEDEHHCLVIELVDGNDLGSLMETRKAAFSLMEVANWAEQLMDALNALHRNVPPLIHRDIKPQNIKLTAEGKIKLMALGNIEIYNSKANAENSAPISDTAALPYQPLEQIWQGLDPASQKVILHSYDERSEKILEQPTDARSDIYALGATFYHLLTGQIPADALARSIDLMDGNADPLTPPKQINPHISTEISDVIMRSMEIKRENRFDSAVIMRQVLRTALVRAKELEAEKVERQNQKVSEEIKLSEQNRLEQERKAFEQKRLELEIEKQKLDEERRLVGQRKLELEAEKKKQAEMLERQLREAETKKRLAVQLAAQVEEKQQSEIQNTGGELFTSVLTDEIVNFDNIIIETPPKNLILPSDRNALKSSLQKFSPAEISPEKVEIVNFADNSSEEFGELFAEPARNNQMLKKMSAAAGVLIILGGAIFGIWYAASSATVNGQNIPSSTISLNEAAKPAATVEPAPAAETKPVPEKSAEPVITPEIIQTQTAAPAVKNKIAAPAATVEAATPKPQKPAAPTVKPTAPPPVQKKAVTVDDIINDN